jgi:hypothetical protein
VKNSRKLVLTARQKPLPIYINNVTNISLIQLLEQITKQQQEIKALTDNQVKVEPKSSDSYRSTTKALAKKSTEFHTYKLKEERSYRVRIFTTASTLKKSKLK